MSIRSALEQNNEKLALQYNSARSDVSVLLSTLTDHVLPQLTTELALSQPELAWLTEWLTDTASIFRLLRRHKFTRSFALQEIRTISIWRLKVLRPILFLQIPTLVHCLPPPITDPLGRPIVFLKVSSLQTFEFAIKDALLQEVERLRLHLRYIRESHPNDDVFPLQYLVLVDLEGVSIQSFNVDFFTWLVTDIIPRYPGMLAAVFLLNYSWMHSGAWSLAKRLLPSSAISRVFFPCKDELVAYCSAAALPAEYGGSLPPLDQLEDALRSSYQSQHLPPPPVPTTAPTTAPTPTTLLPRPPSTITLSPFSPSNPFFGYRALTSPTHPHAYPHVQRGVKDLLRTLAVLWWRRWGGWVGRGAVGVVVVVLAVMMVVRGRVRVRVKWGMGVRRWMERGLGLGLGLDLGKWIS